MSFETQYLGKHDYGFFLLYESKLQIPIFKRI